MKLKDYLKSKSRLEFALKIGTTKPYIDRLLYSARPSPSLALKIERATGGAVSRDELLFPELYVDSTPDTTKNQTT
jgi:DNA-binding transcriptional regulator YdaS (Cro superfamily)